MDAQEVRHYRNLLIAVCTALVCGYASCNLQNYNADRAPRPPRTYCVLVDAAGDATLRVK